MNDLFLKRLEKEAEGSEVKMAIVRILKNANERMEKMRGTGVCVECEQTFPDIEKEFRVRNPFTGETKLSLLCRSCRKRAVEKMKKDLKNKS